jgi:hypothetical protein
MPAPAHARFTFSGTFGPAGAPVEIWSFNINGTSGGISDMAQITSAAAAASTTYATTLRPLFPSDIVLTKVRCALVDDTGHVVRTAVGGYQQADDNTARAGSGTVAVGGRMPLSTALVVSLTTARAGASGKGRFFLPWPQTKALGTDYRMSADDALACQTAARSFLLGVRAALPTGSDLVVASGGATANGVALHGPVLSPVTGLRVGRVPDTMRSRRSGLREEYTSIAL